MTLALQIAIVVTVMLVIAWPILLASHDNRRYGKLGKPLPRAMPFPNSLLLDGRRKLAAWPGEVEWYDNQARIAGLHLDRTKGVLRYAQEEF